MHRVLSQKVDSELERDLILLSLYFVGLKVSGLRKNTSFSIYLEGYDCVLQVLVLATFIVSVISLNLNVISQKSGFFVSKANKTSISCSSKYSSINSISRAVTVRILSEKSSGSGVLVNRKNKTYVAVTSDHVIAQTKNHSFQILTPDGLTHAAYLYQTSTNKEIDVAFVKFTSDKSYQVVAIGNETDLAISAPVYAAGFFNWHRIGKNAVENTRNWGEKAFHLTSGIVSMLPAQSLARGYQLGYSNEVRSGMSGGPVLDQCGQLVGINGKGKHPWQGIKAYRFADGTFPATEMFHQMESLSWAIPVFRIRQERPDLFQ